MLHQQTNSQREDQPIEDYRIGGMDPVTFYEWLQQNSVIMNTTAG